MIPEHWDIRAETVMAWWLENDQTAMENITVRPEGTFDRAIGYDIRKIEPAHFLPGEMVTLHLNREGLYDMLPEGLFHVANRKVKKDTEESVQQSFQFRKEEKMARKFFLPLEQEFYRHKVLTEQAELSTCMSSIRSEHVSAFLQFWDINNELLNYDQKNFMLALLPQLNRIVGDNNKIEMCLRTLLAEEVNIREKECNETIDNRSGLSSRIGDTILGVDSILSVDVYVDEAGMEVVIGPVQLDNLHEYLPGGPKDLLLNRLRRFFFPAEASVSSSIMVEEAPETFTLNEQTYTSRLGFTTVL
jgi:hypothetical protein